MKTLFFLHPIEQDVEQIMPVIRMAAAADAHLDVLVFGTQIPVTMVGYPDGIDASWGEEFNRTMNEVNQRVSEIESLVQSEQLSATVTGDCTTLGQLENLAEQHAIHADAALFQSHKIETTDTFKHAFYGTVFDAGRPALILGNEIDALPSAKRVLFAWDGEPEAARALQSSLAWISKSAEAHVVVVDPDGARSGPNPGDDIAAFLARKKIKVTVDLIASNGKSVAQAILQQATDIDADLIVMGAYGHSRLREWLFGGTTLDVLTNAKIPILMAH